jgi:hypothetical protein
MVEVFETVDKRISCQPIRRERGPEPRRGHI